MGKRILVLGGGQYALPFVEHGDVDLVDPKRIDPDTIQNYNLVVFTGGADVSPRMYRENWNHATTSWDWKRDKAETYLYAMCQRHLIPKVGICRGSQFLTVMNGGSLIQDVNNHAIVGSHPIKTGSKGFEEIQVTSTHHQMMVPKKGYELLAYAEGLSDYYEDGVERNILPDLPIDSSNRVKEPEAVWYPVSHSLAVQFHPEYMSPSSNGWEYFQHLLKEYVL